MKNLLTRSNLLFIIDIKSTQPERDLSMIKTIQRYRGSLMGLVVGDALGASVEFREPGTFSPVADMLGGGPHHLPIGAWTDDTSMALCLAASFPNDVTGTMSALSSMSTHPHPLCVDACRFFGAMLVVALKGGSKEEIFTVDSLCSVIHNLHEQVFHIFANDLFYMRKSDKSFKSI